MAGAAVGGWWRAGVGSLASAIFLSGCLSSGGIGQTIAPQGPAPGTAANANLLAPLDGGLAGKASGDTLARSDRLMALESEYKALEYTPPGDIVTWNGRSAAGQVVPSQPYRVGSQDCRQYAHTLVLSGRAPQTVRGTACRNADGSWELVG